MARYTGPKTKIARKFKEPIYGPDKYFERKNYAPGQHGQSRRRTKLSDYEAEPVAPEYKCYAERLVAMREKLAEATEKAKAPGNQDFLDLCARKLYEMSALTIMGHLILQDTQKAPEMFGKSLKVFMNYAESEVAKHFNYVNALDESQLDAYRQI